MDLSGERADGNVATARAGKVQAAIVIEDACPASWATPAGLRRARVAGFLG